ncbi:hypothetical protein D9758_012797 [Tetrapyrgos nigripes]|uniref:Annexin n=1 Tax=Tetrapyrgos nigripes TaxID=182062 RepID=A0A8H5CYL6_9AGAR|nr:hypothetical protein D9758_012797 [Tetrapyrgos nigripes]
MSYYPNPDGHSGGHNYDQNWGYQMPNPSGGAPPPFPGQNQNYGQAQAQSYVGSPPPIPAHSYPGAPAPPAFPEHPPPGQEYQYHQQPHGRSQPPLMPQFPQFPDAPQSHAGHAGYAPPPPGAAGYYNNNNNGGYPQTQTSSHSPYPVPNHPGYHPSYDPPPPSGHGYHSSNVAVQHGQQPAYGQHTQQVFYLGTPIPPLHLQPSSLTTLVPGYNPNADVEKIRKVTKGFGTNEDAVISTLAPLSALHLAALGAAFKASVGESLVDILGYETSGWFKSTLQAITLGPLFYDVSLIDEALRGAGTDEQLLTELMIDRTPEDLRLLKEGYAYKHRKGGDIDALEREVGGDLSGVIKRLFTMSLSSHRVLENAPVDHALVEKDVKALYEAGQGKIGTDEIAFCNVLVNRSRAHLGVLCEAYEKKYKKLTKIIKSEFSGDLRDTLLYVVQGAKAPKDKSKGHKDKKNKDHKAPITPETWGIVRDVKLLEKSMKGAGTKDKELVRRFVSGSGGWKGRSGKGRWGPGFHRLLIPVGARAVIFNSSFSVFLFSLLTFSHANPSSRRIVRLHWSPTRFRLIKDAYYHKYGKSLEDRVAGETSGDYKKLLVAVIRATG